jgi:hypothetical protein
MQDATARSYTLHEAAALLGIGVNTLRRRIAVGQVQAEQVQRPQGCVWRVCLDARHPPIDPAEHSPNQESGSTLPHPPTAPAAEALALVIQTTIGTVLAPLVGELTASRQTIERQADQLVSQAGTIGRLEAENAVLRAAQASLQWLPRPHGAPGAAGGHCGPFW